MICTVCLAAYTADTCTGAVFRYHGGAGGVWTFCRRSMAEAIAEHDGDPTLDRSWLENVEAVA